MNVNLQLKFAQNTPIGACVQTITASPTLADPNKQCRFEQFMQPSGVVVVAPPVAKPKYPYA